MQRHFIERHFYAKNYSLGQTKNFCFTKKFPNFNQLQSTS